MNNQFERKAGLSLLLFTILLVLTMGLHPAGGNIEHLFRITRLLVLTHAIALLSLPFGWVGFWGLARTLGKDNYWSMLAFATISVGMIAVLMAGSVNGLVLPVFLHHYRDASPEIIDSLRPVLNYSFAVNHAFDYIYTAAFCIAIFTWSVIILRRRLLNKWLGWLGIVIPTGAVITFSTGLAVYTLQGLRVFISAMVVWLVMTGISLYRQPADGGSKM